MIHLPKFSIITPELIVLIIACTILLVLAFFKKETSTKFAYAFAIIAPVLVGILFFIHLRDPAHISFYGQFIDDPLARLLQLFMCILMFLVLVYSREYVKDRNIPEGEYYVLMLFSLLGMMCLVSSQSLLMLYLGLELLSLPIYAMVALWRENGAASEAATKYFVMGALASGMLLYGISLLYGATNSLNINVIYQHISQISGNINNHLTLVFALVFIVTGIVFKFGAAPFHMWVPDVYQGAPTSVTLFIGTLPKLAAFGLLIRLLWYALPHLSVQWQQLWLLVAIVSIAFGNIVAIAQTNIKRMLAYSSIAQIGYMALGVVVGNQNGMDAALFYIISYTLMSAGALGLITLFSQKGYEIEKIEDLRGLNSVHPWFAFMMLLFMFSMAGIPPTLGFFAKLGVLEAVVNIGHVWVAVVALLLAVVGAYYYLRVVKVMYFEEPLSSQPVNLNWDGTLVLSINGILMIILGLFPMGLLALCHFVF